MKVHNFTISILILLSITSCKSQSQHPEVFLGFKMGSSQNQIAAKRDELIKMNLIKIKDGLWVHTNKVKEGRGDKTYYSTPIFNISPGDTLISKIEILYFDDLNYTSNIASKINESDNYLSFNITNKADGEIKIGEYAKKDVLTELQGKYGKFTASDTSYNAVGMYQEGYVWNNGNGLIINLNYGIWKSEMIEAAGMRLEFAYTDDMRKKVLKKISTY